MTAVIEVTGLTKRYGGQAVVDDIAFRVDAGEIFDILGPNGAGKTTAVECMEGLRRRDGGEVLILGLDPLTDRHRLHQRIGVQLQESQRGHGQDPRAAHLRQAGRQRPRRRRGGRVRAGPAAAPLTPRAILRIAGKAVRKQCR